MGIVQCLPLYYFTEHPIMLRNTAGEKGEYPQNSERVKSCSKRHFHPFLSVYLIKSKQGRKRNTSQPLPLCSCKEYRGSARRARGLKFEQEHKPRFRLYRAAKTQGRRKKKGKGCPSEASSADPGGDRNDEPKSPITAAALLGSFFSLLRRMNKHK